MIYIDIYDKCIQILGVLLISFDQKSETIKARYLVKGKNCLTYLKVGKLVIVAKFTHS